MDGTLTKWKDVSSIEELLEQGFYLNLESCENMIKAVQYLVEKQEDIYILSAYLSESKYALEEKKEWLDRYLPCISESKRIFCPVGESKIKYASESLHEEISNQWILLDDYSVNLHDWNSHGGYGIKCFNGINGNNGTWTGAAIYSVWLPEIIVKSITSLSKQ